MVIKIVDMSRFEEILTSYYCLVSGVCDIHGLCSCLGLHVNDVSGK